MDKNIEQTTVVPAAGSATLLDQEGYAVGIDGVKTASLGDFAEGVVAFGRPAGEGSTITTKGETAAMCDGRVTGLSAEDPIVAGSDGIFYKATIGTHDVRGRILEACSTLGLKQVLLY